MKVPNLKVLDASTSWHKQDLSGRRVRVSTTVCRIEAADTVGNFAIETFERAGFELEQGSIRPVKPDEINVELIFKPQEASA